LLPEPFECEAPLLDLERVALLAADLAFAFELAFGFACEAFGLAFDLDDVFVADELARFGADRFFGLVFA
jgi:hypothetical protein